VDLASGDVEPEGSDEGKKLSWTTSEAASPEPFWSRYFFAEVILVAWIVGVAVGLATRHIRFLIVVSIGSAYLLFVAFLGNARREGRMSKKLAARFKIAGLVTMALAIAVAATVAPR
jgi:hypothetical protein